MKIPKLITSYRKYTDSALLTKAESIVLAFTENVFFPKPTPTLAVIQEAITNFSDAIAAAVDGGRIKIAERKQARKVLEDLLRALGAYASMIAMGDVTMLVSTGIDMYKEPEQQPEITAPETPALSSGNNPGEVLAKAETVKGSRSYIFGCTPDPLTDSSEWKESFDSRSTYLFTGLQPGKRHWFRVTVLGLRGSQASSSPVSYMVQ